MRTSSRLTQLIALVVLAPLGAGLAAQSALVQLGLTEAQTREFVLNEIKSAAPGRGANIVVAGLAAF